MCRPPVTSMTAPVTKLAMSLARNRATDATSSGVPIRPSGVPEESSRSLSSPLSRVGEPAARGQVSQRLAAAVVRTDRRRGEGARDRADGSFQLSAGLSAGFVSIDDSQATCSGQGTQTPG